ncbi:Caudovirales tail fibre assembly protein [Citrobacter youngae]|uniref:Caudovirales tail fibre assembly protein n=3 Tax=Enterobacteriaceae TaxID=543 RepID=A0ABM8MPP7_9ENTR|nr:Caudovirales tail fibre assembly protein [Citrobacter youngae]
MDRTPEFVDYIGEIRSGYTTVAPSTQYDKWDGGKWVTDADAQRNAAIANAEKQRSHLLAHADKVMLDWRTELMLGEISDANKAKLSVWMAYKNEVKAVDVTTTHGRINWPEPPED